jgi:uncharacterized protein YerC
MYSVDLSKITVKDFVKLLKSIDLLPGRRILLSGLDDITLLFEKDGIKKLSEIQKLLKNKATYEEVSKKYKTTKEYLTVLNREVNSYINKPIKLDEIPIISKQTVLKLNKNGISTTKDLYDAYISIENRKQIIEQIDITKKEFEEIIGIVDLLRVNGIGPVYAIVLNKIGIKSVKMYLETDSNIILEKFQKENKGNKYTKTDLGIKDVEYCKRFCKYLDQEI